MNILALALLHTAEKLKGGVDMQDTLICSFQALHNRFSWSSKPNLQEINVYSIERSRKTPVVNLIVDRKSIIDQTQNTEYTKTRILYLHKSELTLERVFFQQTF